jgi:hypothetical protein
MDTLTWKGKELRCIDTRGNSPGAMSYFLQHNGRWIAFTGDLMVDGSKLHNWFDSEWDYGFARESTRSAIPPARWKGTTPSGCCRRTGPPIRDAARQLAEFQEKLERFEKLYVRGYAVNTFSGARQDPMSKPTSVPHLWQIRRTCTSSAGRTSTPTSA